MIICLLIIFHRYFVTFVFILQSSEGSRNTLKDKAAELEVLKAKLDHIKALVEDGTRIRDSMDSTSELEQDVDVSGEGGAADVEITEDMANISFECRSDSDDVGHGKIRNSIPTLEEIQVTIAMIRSTVL